MKKYTFAYLVILSSVLIWSCSSDNDSDNEITEEPDSEITDDYFLLAVSDLGEVFRIGNNTGNIEGAGQLNRENNSSLIATGTITSSNENIYAVEYLYNPSPTNNLLIFNRQSNTSRIVPLTLPGTISGDERGIVALTWSGDNLIGVLAENVLNTRSVKHLISIDPQDYSISELGITFNEDRISSIEKRESVLYIATWGEGFLEVNMENSTVAPLEFNNTALNSSRMAIINDTEIAVMQAVEGFINGARPVSINTANQTISDESNGEVYGLVTVLGSSIYENRIYFNLVSRDNLYLGILKSDFQTNENTIVEVNSTTVNRNLIIVDITN